MSFILFSEWMPTAYVWTVASPIRTQTRYGCTEKTHTGLRPFTCDVCNKSFGRKDVLGEHLRAHKNQANYVCQQCGKSFCRRFSLQAHAMSHTPDKKYACKNCPKTYLTKSNFTKHEETHREKETCPKCNVCVMHLKEHTKTCGATSSFQCSTCEKVPGPAHVNAFAIQTI